MGEFQCENCSKSITPAQKNCPSCGFPNQGTKQEKIAYNTRLMKFKDLVEDSDKSVKGIFSMAIIFAFMAVVVLLFSLLFNENHYHNALTFIVFAGIYFLLNRVGKKSSYLMAILTLLFYLGHTIFEFSNGMFLKSPVGLDESFTGSKGASLFFALIPLAYMLFRLALMIVLAKYFFTEFKLRRDEKMTHFIRSKKD